MLKAAEWRYLGEGNANLIVSYTGSTDCLKGKCLRLAKMELLMPVEERLKYQQDAIKMLFGCEYLPQATVIAVSKPFLQTLSQQIESSRPSYRLPGKINLEVSVAVLMENLSYQQDVSIEIKPKWGFSPYRNSCRFCLHQRLKRSLDEKYQSSKYCPLDLYSSDPLRIRKSIQALFETPQNNFKIHSNTLNLSQMTISQLLELALNRSKILDKLKTWQQKYHQDVNTLIIEKSDLECDRNCIAKVYDTISNIGKNSLCRMLLSLSLKDLSLFITFKVLLPTGVIYNPFENYALDHLQFHFRITIIDLDFKSCSKIEQLRKLENQLNAFI